MLYSWTANLCILTQIIIYMNILLLDYFHRKNAYNSFQHCMILRNATDIYFTIGIHLDGQMYCKLQNVKNFWHTTVYWYDHAVYILYILWTKPFCHYQSTNIIFQSDYKSGADSGVGVGVFGAEAKASLGIFFLHCLWRYWVIYILCAFFKF